MSHSPTTPANDDAAEHGHPGFDWLERAACAPTYDSTPFFVDAGRVIDPQVQATCRRCPVRRECILHSYLGGPGATIIGAGYFGGFSLGQRKQMTVEEALRRAEKETSG